VFTVSDAVDALAHQILAGEHRGGDGRALQAGRAALGGDDDILIRGDPVARRSGSDGIGGLARGRGHVLGVGDAGSHHGAHRRRQQKFAHS
jgi:hypothetical protein